MLYLIHEEAVKMATKKEVEILIAEQIYWVMDNANECVTFEHIVENFDEYFEYFTDNYVIDVKMSELIIDLGWT